LSISPSLIGKNNVEIVRPYVMIGVRISAPPLVILNDYQDFCSYQRNSMLFKLFNWNISQLIKCLLVLKKYTTFKRTLWYFIVVSDSEFLQNMSDSEWWSTVYGRL